MVDEYKFPPEMEWFECATPEDALKAEALFRSLQAEVATARNAAIEEAIRAQCGMCERGVELVGIHHRLKDGLTPKGEPYRRVQCAALKIHALKAAPNSQPEPGHNSKERA